MANPDDVRIYVRPVSQMAAMAATVDFHGEFSEDFKVISSLEVVALFKENSMTRPGDPAVPFAFVALPAERSLTKPRTSGLTMVMDWGLPIGQQRDWLELQSRYVDLAKFVVGTSRLYDTDYLMRKIALYKEHEVQPFIGGQFLEYVYAHQGMSGSEKFFAEAARLGFEAIEVSDNYVTLQSDTRRQLVQGATAQGLEVHGEVGSKTVESDGALLISQAAEFFEAGANVVLVEGAELLIDGEPNRALLAELRTGLETTKIIFELSGTWIENTTQSEVYHLKKFLISEFGANVNLANVMPQDIWETEAMRAGLSTIGPQFSEQPAD